ncbi:MAG: bifunctional metallophosphatase/5'-nucleotidase [Spirochaetales bacterium]|nr:bifunctional metallophosphatase/5'-nucleotidase [Candidatus Physcosoma equi]
MQKLAMILIIAVCGMSMVFAQGAAEALKAQQDIVVLYTNDVHCGIDNNLGYAALATVKAEAKAHTPFVTLVDAGDAIQGDAIGTVSNGSYLVDIMNEVGYDFAVFGNHEFDYGMANLAADLAKSNATYLASNIHYTGSAAAMPSNIAPYAIVKYGYQKVAYIGVSTPETITKSTPRYFMEDGKFVYSFDAGEALYATVQSYVDEVRAKGADVVVVISHLGVEEDSAPNRSVDLIANTTGIDVVIDGHSHSTIEMDLVANKAGEDVILTQTGTKLNAIGKLTIAPNGACKTELITSADKNENTTRYIDSIKAEYETALNAVVAYTEVELNIANADGARMVRNRETAIGDLCSDAYRAVSGADIAFVNGGGIRATIKQGDITTANMIAVHPYGNMLCMCYATGQEILDALELGSMNTQAVAADGKNAVGESGGFLQVSGLKYTINTAIPSSVVKDSNGLFVEVAGARRVEDVQVEKNGEWAPIDPEGTYTLACHNYKLQDMGDGYTMFADNEFILDKVMIDNQVIITYICDFLGGKVGQEYAEPQGRITVK